MVLISKCCGALTVASLGQVGEELCIYYGPDDKLWFDYPPDEGDEHHGAEEDPESWLRNVGQGDDDNDDGDDDEDEERRKLDLNDLKDALSPEALAALQSPLDEKTDYSVQIEATF